MKIPRGPLWFVGGRLLTLAIFATWGKLAEAIDCGKCKRFVADADSLVTALGHYHDVHGAYPAGFDFESLRSALEPAFMRTIPSHEVAYYSDGTNYVLSITPGGSDWPGCGLLRIKNGEWDIRPSVCRLNAT